MAFARTLALELQKMPTWAKNILIVSGASIVLGLFAHVAIPLPFTPVPIVTQDSVILLMAVLLGPKRAAASVAAFLAQGALGLPVFANGAGGLAVFMGPRGGYLIGYLAAAFVVAKLVEVLKKKTILNAFYALLAGQFILFALGAAWLSTYVGFTQAIVLGIVPFLIGDAIKTVAILKILQWIGWDKRAVE
jgi:biotin transport system substrate-specific component